MTTRPDARPPAAIRGATQEDAAGIAVVHIASWRETYTRLVPPGAFDDLDPVARTERWRGILAERTEGVWVAERDGVIVGWATVTAATADAPQRLNGLYALAVEHGTGTGQALLDAAIGDAPALLWVADDNPRARAFYTRNGFVPDGARDTHELSGHPIDVIRMTRG